MSQSRHLGMVWFCRSTLCTCSTNIRNNAQELWKKEKEKEKEKEMGIEKKKKKNKKLRNSYSSCSSSSSPCSQLFSFEGEELRAHILDKLSAERSKRSFKILEMEEAIKA